MSTVDTYQGKFDSEGRYLDRAGSLDVVFATRGGSRFPGTLRFRDGLCVRAEMKSGGDWSNPDGSPIDGIRLLLDPDGGTLRAIVIDQGRLIDLGQPRGFASRREFLRNFRVARNLFVHSWAREAGGTVIGSGTTPVRSAVWLAPKSVAGFDVADFAELGPEKQTELSSAIREFLEVADQVPAYDLPSEGQYRGAGVAFSKALDILNPYLPITDEDERVELALSQVDFPPWIVDWNYELISDSVDSPAVRVDAIADERTLPLDQLGKTSLEMTSRIRRSFDDHGIDRQPYVRMMTTREHKVG